MSPVHTTDGTQRAEQEARIKALHDRLGDAVGKLVTSGDWIRALQTAAKFRAYSALNSVLIWVQYADLVEQGLVTAPEPTQVAGVKQWNSLGRHVLRGQHGLQIRLPVTARFAADSVTAPESTWRRLGNWEKLRPGEVLKRRLVNTKIGHVFDVAQTDGKPLDAIPAPVLLDGEAPAGLWDGVVGQLDARGYTVREVESAIALGGANGLTDYRAKTVTVRTDVEPLSMTRTAVHELGHVMLHGPEVREAALHRGIAEVEAESTALLVLGAHGVDTSRYTVPYVASWATRVPGKTQVETVMDTFTRVGKTATTILDQLETVQIANGLPLGLERPTVTGPERLLATTTPPLARAGVHEKAVSL